MKRLGRSVLGVGVAMMLLVAGCGGGSDDNNNDNPDVASLAGTWIITIMTQGNVDTWVMELQQNGDSIIGVSYQQEDPSNRASVTGTLDGNSVTVTELWSDDDGGNYVYQGTIADATHASGTCGYAGSSANSTWTAVKD